MNHQEIQRIDGDDADLNGRQTDQNIQTMTESGMTATTAQGDPYNGSSDS